MSFPKSLTRTKKGWMLPVWALLITFVWLFLWYGPWQTSFHAFTWFRLGIGLGLFIIPGICIYGLLFERSGLTFSHITFGFVISHLLFALLGTLGRFVHLSFGTIKLLMAVLGLIPIIAYLIFKIWDGFKPQVRTIQPGHILPVSLLMLVSATACLVVIQRVLTSDDLSYLAYINNWQHSLHLNFNDIIFGEPSLVHPRFWLMSAPFAQALLADISKMPGISILGGYYEPFLVILSVLCWYELARTLRLSPQAAGISSILQLSFLLLLSEYLHPGAPFFTQLSADKATAAYILAPVFFQSLVRFLESPTKNNLLLFLLAGLSLTFMHAILLAYAVFIGGMLVLLDQKSRSVQKKFVPATILLIILVPQIVLRLVSSQLTINVPYETEQLENQSGIENIITRWGDTAFYGLNPNTLSMHIPYAENIPFPRPIRKWGWIFLPVLSVVFAIRQLRDSIAARFILSCFLLCLLAVIPLTGWIIGYFLSAWMLERAVWLFPFGLSTVYAIASIKDSIKSNQAVKTSSLTNSFISSNWVLITVAALSIGLFFIYMRENNLPDIEKFITKSQRYQDLAVAGQALDHQIPDQAFVIGSPNLNDLIPGLSWKSKLITFRIADPSNMSYFTPEQRDEKISDSQQIFSRSASATVKMELLEKHGVQFLFLQPFDLRLFNELIESYPGRVKATDVGGVIIIGIYP